MLGSIGGTGLGGTPQDVTFIPGAQPVPVSGKFDEAFTDVIHRDFPTWTAGVSLSFPIFLRQGAASTSGCRARPTRRGKISRTRAVS